MIRALFPTNKGASREHRVNFKVSMLGTLPLQQPKYLINSCTCRTPTQSGTVRGRVSLTQHLRGYHRLPFLRAVSKPQQDDSSGAVKAGDSDSYGVSGRRRSRPCRMTHRRAAAEPRCPTESMVKSYSMVE